MAAKYFIAGEDVNIVLPFLVDGPNGPDYVVPDAGSVSYTVRGHTGQPIAGATNVSVPTDADDTQVSVNIGFPINNKTRQFERRSVEYRWVVAGRAYGREFSFFLTDRLIFDATPAEVRERLGVNASELPDHEVDLVAAYYQLGAQIGATTLADKLAEGTYETIKANRALVLVEALRLLPSLRLRAAKAETSGSEGFTRYDIDWDALEKALKDELGKQVELLGTSSGGVVFMLSAQTDPFNPLDEG